MRIRGHRVEVVTLVLIALIAAGVWAFTKTAEEVVEGETRGIDKAILVAMRNPHDLSDPIGPQWLEEIGRDLTALGGVAVTTLLVCGVVGWLLLAQKRRMALFVFASVVTGVGASLLMKIGFDRPRPTLVEHYSIVYTKSFPSGHSMTSAVVYFTLAALLVQVQPTRRLKGYILGCAVVLVVLVGVSRVYLGVHWPTDVLAGWAAGATWALACGLIARWLQRRGKIEPEEGAGEAEGVGERVA